MNNLKALRIRKNLKQIDVANFLNIRNTTYSYWESGKFQPDIESMIKLADYFGVSVDYLLGRTDNPQFSITAPETVTAAEYDLLQNYRGLNDEGKKMVSTLAENLYDMLHPKQ